APQRPPLTTVKPPTWPFRQAEHASGERPRRFATESAPTGQAVSPAGGPHRPRGDPAARNQGPIHGRRLGDRKPATRGQAYTFTVRRTRRSRLPLREPRPLHADSASFSASAGPAVPAVDNGHAAYLAV